MKYFLLLSFLYVIFISCESKDDLTNDIQLSTTFEIDKTDSVKVLSSLNLSCTGITEHGHCWSNTYPEPYLEFASYSCYGPLCDSISFSEKIDVSKNVQFIRAYIIVNSYIVYGETIQVNEKN